MGLGGIVQIEDPDDAPGGNDHTLPKMKIHVFFLRNGSIRGRPRAAPYCGPRGGPGLSLPAGGASPARRDTPPRAGLHGLRAAPPARRPAPERFRRPAAAPAKVTEALPAGTGAQSRLQRRIFSAPRVPRLVLFPLRHRKGNEKRQVIRRAQELGRESDSVEISGSAVQKRLPASRAHTWGIGSFTFRNRKYRPAAGGITSTVRYENPYRAAAPLSRPENRTLYGGAAPDMEGRAFLKSGEAVLLAAGDEKPARRGFG